MGSSSKLLVGRIRTILVILRVGLISLVVRMRVAAPYLSIAAHMSVLEAALVRMVKMTLLNKWRLPWRLETLNMIN